MSDKKNKETKPEIAPEDTPPEGPEGKDGEEIEADELPTGPIAIIRQKLKLILIGLGVVAIIAGAVGIYFSGLGKVVSDSLSGTPMAKLELPEPSILHDMPVITVDLKPSAKRKRAFIKFAMTVEVYGESGRDKLISEEAKILNSVQEFLRDQTFEDVSGKTGSIKLRKEMIEAINKSIAPEKVITVLFKEILVR
ncbi:MAG: flagellar basal body-associated FliL family protein [Rhodospirillaceae bacterium]|nr:flagellar basal body-associated FliL family protein [Rhodospirillaceae bacterium]